MMMEHEGCNDCIDNQKEEIANAKYHEIRMFRITEDLTGEGIKNQKWKIANPENAKEFNAVAYFFARKLYEKLDVPIGIISSAWGGTKIESWTSNKKLKKLSLIKKTLPKNIDIDLLLKERKNYIDSIAKNGVRITQGYVTAAFCSASRAGLLTGRYQTRFGYEFNPTGRHNEDPEAGLPKGEKTLADVLGDAGYITGLFGKRHLGGTANFNPIRRGFDEFYGFLHEGHYLVPPP